MSGSVFDDGPYRITKTRLHNQSIGGLVETRSPIRKKPKAKSYIFKREEKEIDQSLRFYII